MIIIEIMGQKYGIDSDKHCWKVGKVTKEPEEREDSDEYKIAFEKYPTHFSHALDILYRWNVRIQDYESVEELKEIMKTCRQDIINCIEDGDHKFDYPDNINIYVEKQSKD